jgi:hypothetical protein
MRKMQEKIRMTFNGFEILEANKKFDGNKYFDGS